MKSTEIEAERVVSTSGLLTGRPNASWPRRISASPPKTNFFSPPPPSTRIYERQDNHRSFHTTPLLLTPTLRSVVFSLYTTQLPRRCTPHEHMRIRSEGGERASVRNKASALGDGPSARTLTLRSASVASGSAVITSEPGQLGPVEAFPTQESALKIHNRKRRRPAAALFIAPSLYRIIKPISHRTINGHQRQGRFKRNNFSATACWTPVTT